MRGMGEQTTELAHSADSPALAAGRLTPPPLPADWNLCQASSIADEPQVWACDMWDGFKACLLSCARAASAHRVLASSTDLCDAQ